MTDSESRSQGTELWLGDRADPPTAKQGSSETQHFGSPQPAADWQAILSPSTTALELGTLGRFHILHVIGQGGMGVVLRAQDPVADREVAIKVMLPGLANNEESRQRFLREAQAMAAIESDYVIPVYHVDEADTPGGRVPFLAMPLLRGESLADCLRQGPLAIGDALKIGRQMATGLAAAHAKGLIHRDVKPSNVWLDADRERVQLLDFGLARRWDRPADHSAAQITGTPRYMAPEQAEGITPDPRGDLFSLGVVLYELITGRQAFDGPNVIAILKNISTHEPQPVDELNPETPAALSVLVQRLMSKQREQRPRSAQQVADDLAKIEAQFAKRGNGAETKTLAIAARVSDRGVQERRFQHLIIPLVSCALLLAALMAGIAWWPAADEPPPIGAQPGAEADPVMPPPASEPMRGFIDLRVWSSESDIQAGKEGQFLAAPGVLPLRPGNYIRADVEMITGPAYVYVVWLESGGDAVPIYPWGESWDDLAEHEPTDVLQLPGPLGESPSGIETLLLLARETPLTAEDGQRVAELFSGLPVQDSLPDPLFRVWLTNGKADGDRGAPKVKENASKVLSDLQRRLRSDAMQEMFPYTRSVSFSFQGS